MDILINNGKNLQYGTLSMSEEGIRKKEEAESKILAARTRNARQEFQSLLDTAIDALSGQRVANDVAPNELDEIFDEAAETYGVEKQLLLAVARTESNFRATATSGSGAMGIMQLMPETAQEMGVDDAYDPHENIMGGAKLLSILLNRYDGDKSRALAAYNAGGNTVDSYGGVPPTIQGYVDKVMSYYAGGIRISDEVSDNWNASANTSGVAGSLKNAFSKFPEHQSYNAFLQELSEEMQQSGQPNDANQAYRMLMNNARAAIEQVREDLEDAGDDDENEQTVFGDYNNFARFS